MSKTGKNIQAACLQWGHINQDYPELNPFAETFTIDAAKAAIDRRIAFISDSFNQSLHAELDVVVCVEDMLGLAIVGTYLDDPSIYLQLSHYAVERIGPVMQATAKQFGLHLVGSYNICEADKVYNCAILFGPDGNEIGCYRKVHLPGVERWLNTPGDHFPVFDTEIGKIGMLVCYDDVWPEASRCLMLQGADIICHPTLATPIDFRMQARANDNQVLYLMCSRALSMITAPNGKILGHAGKNAELIQAEINVQQTRQENKYHFSSLYTGIQDLNTRYLYMRRPQAYQPLIEEIPAALSSKDVQYANTDEVYPIHRDIMRKELNNEETEYTWVSDVK